MKIAKQGWKFIIGGAAVSAAGAFIFPVQPVLGATIAVVAGTFALFCAYFFRDPERELPTDASKIYGTGDGTVLSVAQEGPGDISTIRIFLSVFDVHIQRLPCSGKITRVQYQKGSFRAAMVDEAKNNERNVVAVAVEGRKEEVVFDQIAGFIARRILCWIKVGDTAVAGERYGLIQFGSQAAIHLPGTARVLVKPGDKIVGGVTEVAEWIEQG